MKMYNLGKKQKHVETAMPSGEKDKIHYPNLILRSDKIPEIKNWETGKKYTLKIVIEQKRSGESYDDDKIIEADFDIMEAGIINSLVDKSEYDKMSDEEKDKEDEKEVMSDK